ncbi:MAG: hypothetical protein K8U57_22175 [Planctomycetes bacterium]|nr:hypothetical protein [Planctomycetota bacterium]
MRMLLGMGLVLVLLSGTRAGQDPIDPKKLVGKWEQPEVKEKKQEKMVMELTADGNAKLVYGDGSKLILTFMYKVEGKMLKLKAVMRDGEMLKDYTITKLTDDTLEALEDKKKVTFKRLVKEK